MCVLWSLVCVYASRIKWIWREIWKCGGWLFCTANLGESVTTGILRASIQYGTVTEQDENKKGKHNSEFFVDGYLNLATVISCGRKFRRSPVVKPQQFDFLDYRGSREGAGGKPNLATVDHRRGTLALESTTSEHTDMEWTERRVRQRQSGRWTKWNSFKMLLTMTWREGWDEGLNETPSSGTWEKPALGVGTLKVMYSHTILHLAWRRTRLFIVGVITSGSLWRGHRTGRWNYSGCRIFFGHWPKLYESRWGMWKTKNERIREFPLTVRYPEIK